MYTRFFGLNEKPFAITPDPRYLFMSDRHGEGLAHLVYGVTESGGFIQLTGEVGTGKTTLVRTLLGQLPAEAEVALILNPQLTAAEFLVAICEELGVPLPADRNSSKDLVDALNLHLLATHARGRRTILLVDEAQNLSAAVLEQLRLLTNLETAKQKLLQIILIAQPELRVLLSHSSLRQLAQRVTGRYHLEPLSREEAARYIDHRLKVAGALGEIFEPAAKREVHRLSGGIPRLMNVICDRALLGAYSRESRTVDKWLVRRAAAEVSGQRLTPVILKWAVPVIGVIGAVLVIAGIWSVLADSPSLPADARETQTTAPGGASAAPLRDAEQDAGSEPAPAVSEPLRHLNLHDRLAAAGTDGGGETAMRGLFGMWGIEYDAARGTACSQAEAQGLRCYFNRGSWNGIRQLDLPVILTLTDASGESYQHVLASLTETSGELLIAGSRTTYPLEEISKLWLGQYLLVWRPPDGVEDTMIRRGTSDASVRWLRQSLAALSPDYRPADPDSHFFDADLERQLMDFQRQHRMRADGVAGERTQIIINSLLGLESAPRLVAER